MSAFGGCVIIVIIITKRRKLKNQLIWRIQRLPQVDMPLRERTYLLTGKLPPTNSCNLTNLIFWKLKCFSPCRTLPRHPWPSWFSQMVWWKFSSVQVLIFIPCLFSFLHPHLLYFGRQHPLLSSMEIHEVLSQLRELGLSVPITVKDRQKQIVWDSLHSIVTFKVPLTSLINFQQRL